MGELLLLLQRGELLAEARQLMQPASAPLWMLQLEHILHLLFLLLLLLLLQGREADICKGEGPAERRAADRLRPAPLRKRCGGGGFLQQVLCPLLLLLLLMGVRLR